MSSRLAKKIATQYMEYPAPLRLQPDYGERNAADFLGDRNVARNTGYGDKIKPGPGNEFQDEVVAESLDAEEVEGFEITSAVRATVNDSLFSVGGGEPATGEEILEANDYDDDIHEALEIALEEGVYDQFNMEKIELVKSNRRRASSEDHMADFWKESRLPSHKHHSEAEVSRAVREWREDNPEVAEKFDEEKVHSEGEMRKKMKQAHYGLLGGRMAEHGDSGSYMSRQNLREISDMADDVVDDIGMEDLDDWVEDKISRAHSSLSDVARYRGYRDTNDQGFMGDRGFGREASALFSSEEMSDLYDEYDFDEDELDAPPRMSRMAASGLYGYTKRVQGDVESAVRQLKKKVEDLARKVELKHPEAGAYFKVRGEKTKCPASKALSQCCLVNKEPTRVLKGPYGFSPSVSKASQKAISEIVVFSGDVAHKLYLKDREHVPFLKEHLRRKRCPYTRLILEALPSDAV